MSVRLQTTLLITSAIAIITAANLSAILLFTQQNPGKAVRTDSIGIVQDIDGCVAFRVDPLMPEIVDATRHLSAVSHESFTQAPDEQELSSLGVPLAGSYDELIVGSADRSAGKPIAQLRHELLLIEIAVFAAGTIIAAMVSKRIVRPVEENYRRSEDLVELKAKAEHASEVKSAFLANTSHEMRTPLNAIIGLSELQLLEQHDAATHADLARIHHAGTTLLSIINDILDISKIESGRFSLIATDYDVAGLINDAVTMSMVRKGSKPIEFDLRVHEELPIRLHGDELRIKQIFNNLLSNAFKYTQEGTVTWQIGLERCSASVDVDAEQTAAQPAAEAAQPIESVYLVSSVTDTGIGIKPDDIKKLFADYNQVDIRSNRNIEGTGLGLAITRRLLDTMGGSIEVQSVYGEGTTFTVRIPQGFVTDEPIDAKTAASLRHFQYTENRRDSGGTRVDIHLPHVQVLVVDDNQTNLAVAQGMLGLYNMQIDCVDSGAKALELIRDESPIYQAIFMDHLMPGMDGIETFERIRDIGTEYATGVPVIALTANAIAGNAEMFESKGFAAFLSKPIDRVQLDTIVSRLFCDGKVSKPGSDLAELGALGIDVASGLGRLGEDVEGYRKVLRLYRTETASLLARLRGFGSEQLDEYAVVVHGIKGSSRGIGAENVAAAAEKLEVAAKAGDWRFVQKESGAFFEQTEVLIVGMEKALSIVGSSKDTPGDTSKTGGRSNTSKKNREKPDHRALKRLREAAADFSIDGIENALDDLEGYDYRTEGELIVWLRGKCDSLAFDEIAARLSNCESNDEYQEAS